MCSRVSGYPENHRKFDESIQASLFSAAHGLSSEGETSEVAGHNFAMTQHWPEPLAQLTNKYRKFQESVVYDYKLVCVLVQKSIFFFAARKSQRKYEKTRTPKTD
jgi:hypothetical protein